jgi:hypothetical protein
MIVCYRVISKVMAPLSLSGRKLISVLSRIPMDPKGPPRLIDRLGRRGATRRAQFGAGKGPGVPHAVWPQKTDYYVTAF